MFRCRGDVNVNGVSYEIADAVIFSNYFISGLSAFGNHAEASIASTDANADGHTLSVADLVFLVRVMVGDASAYLKPTSVANNVTVNLFVNNSTATVSAVSPVNIGAGYFVLEHSGYNTGEPRLTGETSHMSLKYSDEDGKLRILIYSFEKSRAIASGTEDILTIPIIGNGPIRFTYVELADYLGNPINTTIDKASVQPEVYALRQNYPNPFNAGTTILYELPQSTNVRITIINILGRQVSKIVDGWETAGVHSVQWDGTDKHGFAVASGIYLYRLETTEFMAEKKMLLIK
jgi:flagellar hook assembly protein FlgD